MEKHDDIISKPALAALVVIPDTYATVSRTMECLRMQSVAAQIEVIFVVPSLEQVSIVESGLSCFHSWQVIEVGEIASKAAAYIAGMRKAHAEIIALTEDHSFPDEHWAELFIAAHRGPWAAVGPSMRSANPVNLVSWADYYQAYGEWSHPTSTGEVRHLPGHNSSYKREILLSLGEQLDKLMPCESILHRQLQSQGHQLLLETATCTSHTNFTAWSVLMPVKFNSGRLFAATWVQTFSGRLRLLFVAGLPMLPLVRLRGILKNVYKKAPVRLLLQLIPVLSIVVIVEGTGYLVGILSGAGNSLTELEKYEYHRDQH